MIVNLIDVFISFLRFTLMYIMIKDLIQIITIMMNSLLTKLEQFVNKLCYTSKLIYNNYYDIIRNFRRNS